MAITTYSELKTAVADWLSRGDLTSKIPDFIAMGENEIRRRLRKHVARASLTLDSAAVTLPADVSVLRSIRFNDGLNQQNIQLVTPTALADHQRSSSGIPGWASVVNGVLLLSLTPDNSYVAEITYFQNLVALSAALPTNATLTGAPDVYLYAALVRAEPYLEHDERVAFWRSELDRAIQDENNLREEQELGGAPAEMRLPIIFG